LILRVRVIDVTRVSIDLALDLLDAVEKFKSQAETNVAIIHYLWRANMIQTEKCDIIQSRELLHDAVQLLTYTYIVMIHPEGLPQAAHVEDEDLEEIKGWIEDHWQTGTVAICVP